MNPGMEDRCSAGALTHSRTSRLERAVVEKAEGETVPPTIPDCLDKMLAKIVMTTVVCEY